MICKALAREFQGNSPDKIREKFHIQDDLTEVCDVIRNTIFSTQLYDVHAFRVFTGREVEAPQKYDSPSTYPIT